MHVRPSTHPSGHVGVLGQLGEDGLPDDVEGADVVALEEADVEHGEVLVQVVHERRHGVHRGQGVRRPGQVEDVLAEGVLQLE